MSHSPGDGFWIWRVPVLPDHQGDGRGDGGEDGEEGGDAGCTGQVWGGPGGVIRELGAEVVLVG